MNVVFISPHFPLNFYHFCEALKRNGVTALGIGDAPYNELRSELKNSLDEYYRVNSLENYDEVYRAVAFFSFKYGKIDFIESNNEYWLEQDARLREDFNIKSGVKLNEVQYLRHKSKMKELYAKAGVKTARHHLVSDYAAGLAFAQKVGYPLIVKPDDGVGAVATHRIDNEEQLKNFYENELTDHQMIMEEFVDGELVSYDGICNSQREVIYETSHVFPRQVMNLVNEHLDCIYWSIVNIPEALRQAGRAVLKAFPSNSRPFHLEFFILKEDKEGLGQKGDIVALEVNMRPPGGPTLDMMDYGSDIDVYQIWANMVCFDEARIEAHKQYYVVYAARRKDHTYIKSSDEIKELYKDTIVMTMINPEVIATAMGDEVYIARFKDASAIWPFIHAVIEE